MNTFTQRNPQPINQIIDQMFGYANRFSMSTQCLQSRRKS